MALAFFYLTHFFKIILTHPNYTSIFFPPHRQPVSEPRHFVAEYRHEIADPKKENALTDPMKALTYGALE